MLKTKYLNEKNKYYKYMSFSKLDYTIWCTKYEFHLKQLYTYVKNQHLDLNFNIFCKFLYHTSNKK